MEARVRPSVIILIALAILAAACAGGYVRETTPEAVQPTPELVARGAYLVKNVSACGTCHTTRTTGNLAGSERPDLELAGGNVLESSSPHIKAWVPNITSDKSTGIGRWTDDQVMRAIRDGVDDQGKFLLPLMPWDSFVHMSDEDVRAVVAYLRSLPPRIQTRVPVKNEVPFFVGIGLDWFGIGRHRPARGVVAPSPADRVAYGGYLVQLATCLDCHSLGKQGVRKPGDRNLAGSEVPLLEGGEVWARNLTPDPETGIGRYSHNQVKSAIRGATRLDGKKMAPPMLDQSLHYAGMTDADLDAIVDFLFAQPPVRQQIPARKLDAATRARLGEE